MKTTRRYGLVAGLLTVSVMAGSGAQGGDYPEKVVQIIEDSAAGSTPDVALRLSYGGSKSSSLTIRERAGALPPEWLRRLRQMDIRFTSRCRRLSSRCIRRRRMSL